jgi:MFS family permease
MSDSAKPEASTQEAAPGRSLPPGVRILGWTSFLNDVASEMVFPLLPQFLVTVLGGTKVELGGIEGVADSAASILKLYSGGWSDRAGKRKGFVVFGYALATFARALIGLAVAPWHMLAGRLSDRIGKGVRSAPRDALIADTTDPAMRGRAFGFQRAMDHLGAAVGPLLAAAFLWFRPDDLRLLFLLTLIPGVIAIGLVAFALRERRVERAATEATTLSFRPFDRNFRVYLVALAVFTLGNSSDAFLLVRAGELGVPNFLLPILWFMFHAVKSGGSFLAGSGIDRFGARALVWLGWAIYAGVYLAFGMASEAWHVWALFAVYAVYYALTEPAEKTLVAQLAGAGRRGLAYGWYNFAIGLTALPASVIFGYLYDSLGAMAAFGFGACLAFVAAVILLGVRIDKQDETQVEG